jgi:hypothetical protein
MLALSALPAWIPLLCRLAGRPDAIVNLDFAFAARFRNARRVAPMEVSELSVIDKEQELLRRSVISFCLVLVSCA